jgi:type II secretory pathway component PulK
MMKGIAMILHLFIFLMMSVFAAALVFSGVQQYRQHKEENG